MRIICGIVTYNRKKLLKKCIDSVIQNGFLKEDIILVDNFSDDGTEKMIEESYKNKLQYHRLSENTGGAGGFHTATKLAYESGADWILLFDDDVEMLPSSQQSYRKYFGTADIIIGRKKNADGSDHEYGHNVDITNGKLKKITQYDKDLFIEKDFIEMNVVTFEGVMISKKVIEKIGLPENIFFIQGDDTWFGLKAFLNGFKIIYIKDYTFIRLLGENVKILFGRKMEKLKAFSLYYQIRNKFLLNTFLNTVLTKRVNHTFYIFTFSLLVCFYVLLTQKNKLMLIKALFNGYKDGILGKTGK